MTTTVQEIEARILSALVEQEMLTPPQSRRLAGRRELLPTLLRGGLVERVELEELIEHLDQDAGRWLRRWLSQCQPDPGEQARAKYTEARRQSQLKKWGGLERWPCEAQDHVLRAYHFIEAKQWRSGLSWLKKAGKTCEGQNPELALTLYLLVEKLGGELLLPDERCQKDISALHQQGHSHDGAWATVLGEGFSRVFSRATDPRVEEVAVLEEWIQENSPREATITEQDLSPFLSIVKEAPMEELRLEFYPGLNFTLCRYRRTKWGDCDVSELANGPIEMAPLLAARYRELKIVRYFAQPGKRRCTRCGRRMSWPKRVCPDCWDG